MTEFVLIVLVMLLGSLAVFLVYDRFRARKDRPASSTYVQALLDLLDGKQESAFAGLRQTVADDSNNVDAYLRLGQILRENNSADRALQVHKDLTLRGSLTADEKRAVLRQLASDYLALGEPETAERALRELIAVDSHNRWAHGTLLKLQESAAKWEDAYNTAVKLLKLDGDKSRKPLARHKYQMGEELFNRREYHKARIIYKEAIGLDPAFAPAYLAIGDAYRRENRFEDSVAIWMKLISVVPAAGHLAIERLKKTLFDLGRFGDIVGICESILEHDPRNIEARRTLAEFYEKKGDLSSAAEVLEQVLDDNPGDSATLLALIRVYLEKGDERKVRGMLRDLERKREAAGGAMSRPAVTAAEGSS